MTKKWIQAIDMFCGIGGMSYGMRMAGIDIRAGLDSDRACIGPYGKNNCAEGICAEAGAYDFRQMKKLYSPNTVKVLAGCPPCQPFSPLYNKDRAKDLRWGLIGQFLNAITTLAPHIIIMENVRGVAKTKEFADFTKKIQLMGYFADYRIVNCAGYGVPQERKRLVLLASKLGEIRIPPPTLHKGQYVTVGQTIRGMPPMPNGKDPLHRCIKLGPLNTERIRQSKPKGSWKDWDPKILPECYKKNTGKTFTSVYGRMGWENVAPTITTQFYNYGAGRFGHPQEDRALSIREGALLQTFPKDYFFGEKISLYKTGKHIGNAVPPKFAEAMAKKIIAHAQASTDKF